MVSTKFKSDRTQNPEDLLPAIYHLGPVYVMLFVV